MHYPPVFIYIYPEKKFFVPICVNFRPFSCNIFVV